MFEKLAFLFNRENDDLSETLISYGDCCAVYSFKEQIGDKYA